MRSPTATGRPQFRRIALATVALALLVPTRVPTAAAAVSLPTGFVDDTLLTGLNLPTSMAFLPDGRLLFTEQYTANVRLVVNGHIASTDPIAAVGSVNVGGYERGLEGITVDPAWPTRPYIYLFYSHASGTLHLDRFTASGDLSDPNGENLTLGSPLVLIGDILDLTPRHQAGCLRFAPDGMLMVTVGEDDLGCPAQDSTSLHGAILRLKVNTLPAGGGGQVLRSAITPSNNPLSTPDSNAKLVFAYGFRNPYRMQIDRPTGRVFVADPGQDTAEELDLVPAGANAGWPYREGTHVMVPSGCSEPGGVGASPYLAPIVNLDRGPVNTVIQVAGMYRAAGGGTANWPAGYFGDLFYGEYYSGFLKRLRLSAGTWVPGPSAPGQPDASNWATGLASCVDFQLGPDGSLWWLEQSPTFTPLNGALHRIRWTGPSTPPPPASAGLKLTPTPFAVTTELSFTLATPVPVSLTIHDLAGRTVRRLLWSEIPPLDSSGGAHVMWDGTAGDGRHLPGGMYFARLEVGGHVETSRLVRIP